MAAILPSLVMGVASLLLLVVVCVRTDRSFFFPLVCVFSFNLVSGLFLFNATGLGVDASLYDETARGTLAYWTGDSDTAPDSLPGKTGYVWFLAAVYLVLGVTPYPILVLNALAVALSGLAIARTVGLLGGLQLAQKLGAWSGILVPGLVFWTKDVLREPYIFLFTALSAMAVILCADGRRWISWSIISVVGLFGTRQESVIIVGAALIVALLLSKGQRFGSRIFVLAASGLLVSPVLAYALRQLPSADLQSLRVTNARGATSIAPGTDLPIDPLSVARSFGGPFPWEWSGPLFLLAIDAVFSWIILFFAIYWVRRNSWPGLWALFLPAVALYLVVSVTAAYNYGLLVRIRTQPLVLLLPLGLAGLGDFLDRFARRGSRPSQAPSRAGASPVP